MISDLRNIAVLTNGVGLMVSASFDLYSETLAVFMLGLIFALVGCALHFRAVPAWWAINDEEGSIAVAVSFYCLMVALLL